MSKRIIITGAASGIGEATAAGFRARGDRVIGLDLNASGDEVLACDVRDQAVVDSAVAEAIERLGGVDILINCAGIGIPQSAGTAPDDGALAVIDINLLGPWRVTSAALSALRESRGRVINIASGLAHVTMPFATAYVMSKRGVVGYSDALRLEHGDAITVTTIYPGYIKTPIHDASKEAGAGLEGVVPPEPLSAAVDTLIRAAIGPPARDLATTRTGTVNYLFARHLPRRLFERLARKQMTKVARNGHFDNSEMTRGFGARLGSEGAGRNGV